MLFFKGDVHGYFVLLLSFMRVGSCLKTRRRVDSGKILFWDVTHKIDGCKPSVFPSLFFYTEGFALESACMFPILWFPKLDGP